MPKKGLEPPHPCEYMDLNHARLPIPPLRHFVVRQTKTGAATGLHIYSKGFRKCVKRSAQSCRYRRFRSEHAFSGLAYQSGRMNDEADAISADGEGCARLPR